MLVMAKKVLVIDDSIMIRKMVASILTDQFEVLEAKDGIVGLDIARKSRPDLILLDFVMPKMDGYDTMQAIRREEDLVVTPIIMMSGLKEQVTSRIPEPFVGFDFIEKPFEAEALIERINKTLQLSPVAVDEPVSDTIQSVLHKLTAVETLLIQGTENLIQREVVSRLTQVNERIDTQEGKIDSLEGKLDKLIHEMDRHNRGLVAIANEIKQIRKLLSP
jgi:DNA-binding response OmpR family regulator